MKVQCSTLEVNDNVRPEEASQLDRSNTNAASASMNENTFARLEPAVQYKRLIS